MIRLAKEGLREYREQLDSLECRFERRGYDRDDDCRVSVRDRDDDTPRQCRDEDDDDRDEECRLTEGEIHRLFEKLAIHRARLNGRSYPYTEDVIEEQQKCYPNAIAACREEVEAAWDDWRNDAAKRLFRPHAYGESGKREEGHSGDENKHPERRRRPNARGRQKKLTQRELRAIFTRLDREGAVLDGSDYPYTSDVTRLQREMFEKSSPVTAKQVRVEFDRWPGRQDFVDARREAGWDQPRPVPLHRRRPGDRPPGGEDKLIFRIFDEIILDREKRPDHLTAEGFPDLAVVSRLMEERGGQSLEREEVLQREWMEYLTVAAKARGPSSAKERGAKGKLRPA